VGQCDQSIAARPERSGQRKQRDGGNSIRHRLKKPSGSTNRNGARGPAPGTNIVRFTARPAIAPFYFQRRGSRIS
jgi:hypothetical protein